MPRRNLRSNPGGYGLATVQAKERMRRNPDERLRQLERAARTGGPAELAAHARARLRAGEKVQTWELYPESYTFLRAWELGPEGRVEAWSGGDPLEGPLLEHLKYPWKYGRLSYPGGVGVAGPRRRFYVMEFPYPVAIPDVRRWYRGMVTPPSHLWDNPRVNADHVSWWVEHGAIPVQRTVPVRPYGGEWPDPEMEEAANQTVLVAAHRYRSFPPPSRTFPGDFESAVRQVILPEEYATGLHPPRIMKRVGKDRRWKNPQEDLPSSPGFDEAVLRGEVVVTERCPACGTMFAYPTGDVLTCGDCYTEFLWRNNPDERLRRLERIWNSTGDAQAAEALSKLYQRAGNPFKAHEFAVAAERAVEGPLIKGLSRHELLLYRNAGSSYPSGASPEERVRHRVKYARRANEALKEIERRSWRFHWEEDMEVPFWGDVGEGNRYWVAMLIDEEGDLGDLLASVSGIETSEDQYPDERNRDPYFDVVEAELALEALENEEWER